MDNKPTDYKSIRLILCMLLFPLVYSFDYSCPSFNCGDLTDRNNCVLKAKSTNNYTISFLVNECLDSDNICPFAASTNGTETKCIPRRLDKMAFPGQSCDNKNRLCFPEFTCSNKNICKGSSNWEPCFNADECNVGWTCRANETSPLPNNKICQPQLNLGDKCKSDLDCLNYMGCYEGKCIEYFSLDNGEKARSSEENYFSFCKSGEEIDGMCSESTLLDQSKLQKGECTKENTCIYKLHNSSTIFIPSKCQCSFSKRGKKFCEIGSSHSDKKSYFKTLKRSLMSGACHTVERR